MKIVIIIFVIFGVKPEVSAVKFILHDVNVNWTVAKSRCEALRQRLAVVETEEKLTVLKEQVCVIRNTWIGFRANNDNNTYVWLNGYPLPNDDENWQGDEPDHGADDCGHTVTSHEWRALPCYYNYSYICEMLVCLTNHKMLSDGTCYEYKRSAIYDLKERDVAMISDNLVSVQVRSKIECEVKCVMRNCDTFSFKEQTPDGGICNNAITCNVSQQPPEGALYYIKP